MLKITRTLNILKPEIKNDNSKVLDLVIVMMVKSLLKNQENYLNPKNCLSQEKSRQKI